MTDRQDNEKTWLEEKMEDPQFRASFAQEQASLRFRDQFEDAMEKKAGMPTKPFDRYTMSPTQEPEPLLCRRCGNEAPRFYEGQICRGCKREEAETIGLQPSMSVYEGREVILRLDEEKEEHLEQYIFQLEQYARAADDDVAKSMFLGLARDLKLINAGVSPDDIRHGTYPNLSEFEIEPSGD